ncbi:MAG: right-handed parallel beta-helix repeat-containing protein, partial [Caldilineaceae bacterium]|nr:right-handed parallel beta-helix repeat-containing protein [Caldilineaceae bacterium]
MTYPAAPRRSRWLLFPRTNRRSGHAVMSVLILLSSILVLSAANFPFPTLLQAEALPIIRYSSTSNSLTIGRPYLPLEEGEARFITNPSHPDAPKLHITLPELHTWAMDAGEPSLIVDTGNGIWEIAVHITIEDTAQLDLTAGSGVQEIRLISRPDASHNLIADGGTLHIDGIKLYSWDDSPDANSYDTTYLVKNGVMQTRSFLAALYGGRMDIHNAEIMYLGYEERNERVGYGKGEPSGLSWRLRPPGADDPAGGPKGSIVNSKVHHNYFGMYSYEAVELEIRDSEFYEHYFYGLDPHDYSYGFVVANNIIRDNGYTGLIFSRHCTDNEIYENEIYNNGAHGFMLDRGSDRNLVRDNVLRDNVEDGIAIYQSSDNVIEGNEIRNNGRSGIRISAEFDADDVYDGLAIDNVVWGNTISDNGRDGIYVVDRADRNRILGNGVERNARSGLLLNSGLSIVQNNRFVDNGREGILLSNEVYLSGNGEAGESLPPLGEPAVGNQLLANHVQQNDDNGIVIDGGGENRIGALGAGNVITGNVGSGLLLDRTGHTIVAHNEIYQNVADNGAGIELKCDDPGITYDLVYNTIIDNQATDAKGRGAGILLNTGCFPLINNNRIYNNVYPSGIGNLQNKNPNDSATVDATANIWA